MNRLTLIGFLGGDAEKRDGNSGSWTVFNVATKTSWKNKSTGQWESRTEWHRCVAGGERLATFAATLKKGAHVHVEGELRSREYEKDGVTHRVFECRLSSILKLDRVAREDEPADDPAA
jgi:single-strand DNA-binding protein